MTEWQLSFEVRGLVSPKDGIMLNDILFKRAKRPDDRLIEESDDLSLVFFKKAGEKVSSEEFLKFRANLERILWFYGLVAGRYASLPNQASSISEITEKNFFGNPFSLGTIEPSVILNKKQIDHYQNLLKTTLSFFQRFDTDIERSGMKYLRNAIMYYYKALEDLSDFRLEEALIGLIVSLESLIGTNSEIRYRISLRASTLLSINNDEKRHVIFKQVYDLYDKRNKVVHGKTVNLSYESIFNFSKRVRNAIIILLHFNKGREEITGLIDESILKSERKEDLSILYKQYFKA